MNELLAEVDLSKPPVMVEPEPKDTEEKEKKEEKEKTLGEVLQTFPGAPDDSQIEKWKQEHGEVLSSAFSETEIFIFRPIKREEFVNLQKHIAQEQQQGNTIDNFEVEEKIVEQCTLWMSPLGLTSLENKAGSLSTLHEQILQQSNFVNPAYASTYVVKL